MADEPTPSGWLPPHPPEQRPGPPRQPGPAPAQPVVRTRAPEEANGLAVTALVLGMTGIGVLIVSLGLLFVVTLPCSIAAWICAAHARNRIDRGETSAGQGQAQAATMLGVLGMILGVLALAGWTIAVLSGLTVEDLRELERR